MIYHASDGRAFEIRCDLIEATSLHRPDDRWAITDAAGHTHQWHFHFNPCTYRPDAFSTLPTLRWEQTGVGYYEDGETYVIGHHLCRACGEVVEPGYTADEEKQYVAGLRSCFIDGEPVSREYFEAELAKVHP